MEFYNKYKYKASQTSIKDFEKEETCPFRWKKQWFDKEFKFKASLPMIQGLYFEQLVIGGSATDEEYTMPINRDGKKKVAHVRIDEQSEYCKEVLFNKDFDDYIGKYVGTDIEWKEFQYVVDIDNKRIVIDMLGECEEGIVIGDLKLTADVNNVFGPFAWGKVSNMDLFQQGFYQMVYEKETGKKVAKNLLVVFDHGPKKGKKIIDLTLTDSGRYTIIKRVNEFENVVNHYEQTEWVKFPSVDECSNCPLGGTNQCSSSINELKVVAESVKI